MAAPRTLTIFGVPKVHKSVENPPMRPRVDGRGSITVACAQYVDHKFKYLLENEQHLCKDSWDFLQKLNEVIYSEMDLMVTIDIRDLYTVIPHTIALGWTQEYLEKRGVDQASSNNCIELLDIILKNNLIF